MFYCAHMHYCAKLGALLVSPVVFSFLQRDIPKYSFISSISLWVYQERFILENTLRARVRFSGKRISEIYSQPKSVRIYSNKSISFHFPMHMPIFSIRQPIRTVMFSFFTGSNESQLPFSHTSPSLQELQSLKSSLVQR